MTISLLGRRELFGAHAAVIADARRRQRRRYVITATAIAAGFALVLFLLLVLPFGHGATARQTTWRLYLSANATPGDTQRALAATRAEHGVVGARIYSKSAALAAFRERYPELVANLVSNPLPNSIDVRITDGVDPAKLFAALKAKHVPVTSRPRPLTEKSD
jgi:cell division protein FtsX